MGRFGTSLAQTLYSLGNDVLAIDINEEKIAAVSDYVTHAVTGDATDEQTGVNIVRSALEAPIRKIASNAGQDRITSYNVCYTKLLR